MLAHQVDPGFGKPRCAAEVVVIPGVSGSCPDATFGFCVETNSGYGTFTTVDGRTLHLVWAGNRAWHRVLRRYLRRGCL